MYRYDSSKGRYVNYDYEPKGDRFTRGLSERPRVITTASDSETGRRYKRRVRTNEARYLTVSQVKAMLAPELMDDLEHRTFYYRYEIGLFDISEEPPGSPLYFEVTEQAKGRRHWFVCLGCGRRVGKLFVVETDIMPIWGCLKCLGLSYPSQAGHKTPTRDIAITQGRTHVSRREELRAYERECRRLMRLSAGIDRMLGRHDLP